MNPAEDRLARFEEFEAKQYAAIDAVAAVIEAPHAGEFPQRRDALIEVLTWLEAGMLCGDCLRGSCHWGGQRSVAALAAVEAGEEYTEPGLRGCGCARHEVSVAARQRRARLKAAGLLP
jgi:hypothetical protein